MKGRYEVMVCRIIIIIIQIDTLTLAAKRRLTCSSCILYIGNDGRVEGRQLECSHVIGEEAAWPLWKRKRSPS